MVGFFILQHKPQGVVNWLLTAIAPGVQGKGYGRRVWSTMLHHHLQQGVRSVLTTISARNVPVLNFYSSLGFRFQPPEMTFHWVNS